jgi:hypothetical protein
MLRIETTKVFEPLQPAWLELPVEDPAIRMRARR